VVFVVETLWSILLVWVGFHTTAFIQDFEHTLHSIGVAALIGIVVYAVLRFLRKRIDQQELAMDPLIQHAAETAVTSNELPVNGRGAEREVDLAVGEKTDERQHQCVALPEREHIR
jgi:hypothetical protein